MAGILAGDLAPGRGSWALAEILLAAAITLAALVFKRRGKARFGLLLIFFSAGYLAIQPDADPRFPKNHVSNFLDGPPSRITGIVAAPPEIRPEGARFDLETETILDEKGLHAVTGKIRVTSREALRPPAEGDRVSLSGHLRSIRSFRNPGSFDYASYMAQKGIFGSLFWGEKARPVIFPAAGQGAGWIRRFRERVRRLAVSSTCERGRELLLAVVLGDTGLVSRETRDAFSRSGTSHLLAVSGLHLGLAAGLALLPFSGLLGLFPRLVETGRARRAACALALFPALFYGVLTGMSPSTSRAMAMVSVFFLSYGLRRQPDALNTLAAAALAILFVSPSSLFNISFTLSFLSVLFILMGMGRLSFVFIPPRGSSRPRIWAARAAAPLGMTVFATLGTLPVVLRAFNQASLAGLPANFIMVPLTGLAALPAGLSGAFLTPICPGAASWLLSISGFLMDLVGRAAAWFAAFPWASVMPVRPSVLESALYYLAVLCIFEWKSGGRAKILLFVALAAFAADAAYWRRARFSDTSLRVTVLDVGQGSSAVVEFPGGRVMLVDGGGLPGDSGFDV